MPFVFKRQIYKDLKEHDGQFPEMVTATVVTSVISIIATLSIIASYIYVRYNNPSKADRVSLRCVFMSSIMNLINSIFDICTILKDGDNVFCKTTSIITMFTTIMGVIFLTLVGINLILVFVFKVKNSVRELECIYYSVAVLYALIAISVPISLRAHEETQEIVKNYRCYYYIYYYQFFDQSSLLWMWFYSFLFFSIFTAAICSVIAAVKLIREQRIITQIDPNDTIEPINAAINNDHSQYNKNHSSVFRRVVIRCVMYPLVPLVSNIWGLIFQLLLNDTKITYGNNLPLSLLDIVFGGLQGLFVAIVFFSDPTMVEYIQTAAKYLKYKHFNKSTCKQSEAGLVTTPTSSLKQPYILTPPTAVLTGSDEESPISSISQIEIARTPTIDNIDTIPVKPELKVSLGSEHRVSLGSEHRMSLGSERRVSLGSERTMLSSQ